MRGGDDDAAELAKPGTVALAGATDQADYRLTVRLHSDDDDAIGVVVRYQDADNWYRFSMDRERSYRRLVKATGGTVTELWSDTEQYVVGREYLLTIDVVGDAIVGYVDGIELFAVRDRDIPAGSIGLYRWSNPGTRFASAPVTPAGWSTYYRFGIDEPPLAAGTRVLIHAGNAAAWSAAPAPGVVDRFVATLDKSGESAPAAQPTGRAARARRSRRARTLPSLPAAGLQRDHNGPTAAARGRPRFRDHCAGGCPDRLAAGRRRVSIALHLPPRQCRTGSRQPCPEPGGDTSNEVVALDIP